MTPRSALVTSPQSYETPLSTAATPLSSRALPQVILCFSPVGSTLRVRAKRFPAVVNCTAIDWFHEWPEDALVSVSSRFLEETKDIEVRRDPGSAHAMSVHSRLCWRCPGAQPAPLLLSMLQHARGWALTSPMLGRWGQMVPCSPFVLKTPPQITAWKEQLFPYAAQVNPKGLEAGNQS